MMQKLMEHDSRLILAQDDEGLTPLHLAATVYRKSILLILKVLLEYDRNNRNNYESSAVYIQDNKGCTALHIAIVYGNWDVMKSLISSYPDCIEIKDNNGQNVVHYAAKWNCVARFRAFLDLGHFDNLINENDVHGNTPLHILAASIVKTPHHWCWCLREASSFIKDNPLLDVKVYNRKNLTFGDIIVSNEKTFFCESLLQHFSKYTPRGRRIIKTYKEDDIDIEEAKTTDIVSEFDPIVEASKSDMVVAALIATVSFTAGLTLPGGFNQNPGPNIGMAVLKSKASFRAFLISDIIAFSCSTAAILFYFIISSSFSKRHISLNWRWASLLTVVSMGAMGIALMTGVCAVLSHSTSLVIVIWVISAILFVCYIPLLVGCVYNVTQYYIRCALGSYEILRHRPIIKYRLFFAAWKFW